MARVVAARERWGARHLEGGAEDGCCVRRSMFNRLFDGIVMGCYWDSNWDFTWDFSLVGCEWKIRGYFLWVFMGFNAMLWG